MNNSYWLRSSFYTLSEKAAALVFGFGGGVLLFRVLEPEEFAVWALFLTITSILEVGRIGLLQNGLVKYLTTSGGEEAGKITTASFVLNCLLTLGIVAVLLGLSLPVSQWLHAPELAVLFKIYCMTTVALIPFFQGNYIQQANLDFRGVFWSNLLKGGILFGFILYTFASNHEMVLTELAVCQIVAAVFSSFVAWLFSKKYFKFSRTIDWGWVKKLFHYGKYVFGTNLSTQLYKSTDKLLLGSLAGGGLVAVALYEAAIRVTNLTDVPTASMANMLFPQSARRFEEGKAAVRELYEKAVGAILAIMLPCIIGVLVLADWIIRVVTGSGYEDSVGILRITIFFGLFLPYIVQFGTVLDSMGKTRTNFIYTICSLCLTVVLNIVFIQKWGAYGAAIGTLSAYVVTFIFMQIWLNRHLGINPLRPFKYAIGFYSKAFNFSKDRYKERFDKSIYEVPEISDPHETDRPKSNLKPPPSAMVER